MLLFWSSNIGSMFQSLHMNCSERMETYFVDHWCCIWNTKTSINFGSVWFWELIRRWSTNCLQINGWPITINNGGKMPTCLQWQSSWQYHQRWQDWHGNSTGNKTGWNKHKLLLHLHCSCSLLMNGFLLGRQTDFLKDYINKKLIP